MTKMDNKSDKGPITWIKKLLTNEGGSPKQGKVQYIIIVALFGAAIMLLSNMFFSKEDSKSLEVTANDSSSSQATEAVFGQKDGSSSTTEYEKIYKEEIKEAINSIAGVKDAIIYIHIDGSEKKIFEKDTTQSIQKTDEKDTQGGNRTVEETTSESKVVLVPNGEKQVPLVVETKKPKITGVLVVAKGAENIKVKSMIIEAVTRALDVPSHRVSVQPKQN